MQRLLGHREQAVEVLSAGLRMQLALPPQRQVDITGPLLDLVRDLNTLRRYREAEQYLRLGREHRK